jgi:hypothetical protein
LESAVRLSRVISVLLASGLALLIGAFALSAYAASPYGQDDRYASNNGYARQPLPSYQYTDHAQPASTGRTVALYIDADFPDAQRQAIVSAMRQWNYVLNGYVQFRARTLPQNTNASDIAQLRRSGAWIVALVDSRHPIAQQGEGAHALAVTVGNGHDGFVYVIRDRIGGRRALYRPRCRRHGGQCPARAIAAHELVRARRLRPTLSAAFRQQRQLSLGDSFRPC